MIMRGNHVRIALRAALRGWLVAVALAAVSLSTVGQPLVPSTATNTTTGFGCWYFAGGCSVGASGSNLAPLNNVKPANPSNLSGWTPAGNYGLAPSATGITVNSTGDVPIPGAGKSAGVGVASKVTPGSFAKAIGPLVGNLAKTLGQIGTGIAIYDLVKGLQGQWELYRDGDPNTGEIKVHQVKDGNCTVGPCYNYWISNNGAPQVWSKSAGSACSVFASYMTSAGYDGGQAHTVVGVGGSGTSQTCTIKPATSGSQSTWGFNYQGRATDPYPEYDDRTMTDLENAIAAQSGWPQNAAAPLVARQALENNIPLQFEKPTVTGPASIPGPTTTTTEGTSTTTKQTTYNITYQGDTINYTTTVVTTVNNNGTTTTSTQTSSGTPPSDTDACKSNPDSVGCQKLGDPPKDEIPKSTKTITYEAEDLGFGGGSCPAPVNLGPGRVLSFQPICDRLIAARPMVLAMAAFSALLIVLGIRSEES